MVHSIHIWLGVTYKITRFLEQKTCRMEKDVLMTLKKSQTASYLFQNFAGMLVNIKLCDFSGRFGTSIKSICQN